MQLMPETATEMYVKDIFDEKENIEGGVRYLRVLANQFEGDMVKMIAAYNAGPDAVRRNAKEQVKGRRVMARLTMDGLAELAGYDLPPHRVALQGEWVPPVYQDVLAIAQQLHGPVLAGHFALRHRDIGAQQHHDAARMAQSQQPAFQSRP